MIRSRLLSLLLLLAYLGVTPAGVYTCACFIPGESALPAPAEWDDFPEQTPASFTAVASLLTYFSLTFLVVAALCFLGRFGYSHACWPFCLVPPLFKRPPPTPPPHPV